MYNIVSNKYRLGGLIALIYGILIIAHGAYNTLFDNLAINLLTLVFISIIMFLFIDSKNDLFKYVLIIYGCSHFDVLQGYGGLFVLSAGLVLIMLSVIRYNLRENYKVDKAMMFLLGVFFVFNIAGWVLKNHSPGLHRFTAYLTFAGYISIFWITIHIKMNTARMRQFLIIMMVFIVHLFIVAVNNILGGVKLFETHLMPTNDSQFLQEYVGSTFNDTELFGEFGLVVTLFLIPIIMASQAIKNKLRLNRTALIIVFTASFLNLVLSFSRSAVVLFGAGIIFIFLLYPKHTLKVSRGSQAGLVLLIIISLFVSWNVFNLGFFVNRFTDKSVAVPIYSGDTDVNVITGEGTPRSYAFSFFIERLPTQSWWVGYGLSDPPNNRVAWFVNPNVIRADYHSLYLSLPMLYGWLGAAAFLAIMVLTIFRLYKLFKIRRYLDPEVTIIAFSFLVMLIFISFNEYKINAIRNPAYHMLFWIWFGLGNSLYNTYYKKPLNKQ